MRACRYEGWKSQVRRDDDDDDDDGDEDGDGDGDRHGHGHVLCSAVT